MLLHFFLVCQFCVSSSNSYDHALSSTILASSQLTTVDSILVAAELARTFVESGDIETREDYVWLYKFWDSSVSCLRRDYVHMNATCTDTRKANARDPCSVRNHRNCPHCTLQLHLSTAYENLVNRSSLVRTAKVIHLLQQYVLPKIIKTSSEETQSQKVKFGQISGAEKKSSSGDSRRGIPAIIHQMWTTLDVGEETEFLAQMNAWESKAATHLVWSVFYEFVTLQQPY